MQEVFDLGENNFVELKRVSTPKLPVSKDNISQQEHVSKYPHLKSIQLPKSDACIGLLLWNDVSKAIQLKEVKECKDQGPYAVRAMFGWTINGPLERKGNSSRIANFTRADNELSQPLGSSATWSSVTQATIKTQKCQRKTYMQ